MSALPLIFVACLGLILGSFLNALLFRFNTGKSVMRGRSMCMHCGHKLSAADLVPLLSYSLLGGRCRYCRAKISPQYPAVELAAAALAVAAYIEHPELVGFSLQLLASLTLLFIFVYDLRHKIIPWSASLLLIGLSLVYVWSLGFDIWNFAAGPALGLPLLAISAVSGGRWMGWGDGILELSLGWFLGLTMGLTALFFAFWSGALVGLALILAAKNRYTMRSEVPFAPFLILGAAAAHFFHADLFATLPALFL